MSNSTVHVNKIDNSKLSFVAGKKIQGRNPGFNLKYDGNWLQLRLPKLNFPGGTWMNVDKESGKTSYSLSATLKDCDPYGKQRSEGTDDNAKLYNFLLDLENMILREAEANSVGWFAKKRSADSIKDGFKRLINVSSTKNPDTGEYTPNGKYPPSIRIKVPVYDGKVSVKDIIDSSGNDVYVTPDTLCEVFSKGTNMECALGGKVYIMAGGGFGLTWTLNYAKIASRSNLSASQVFADNDDEEDAVEPADSTVVDESQKEAPQVEAPPAVQSPVPARKKRVSAQ